MKKMNDYKIEVVLFFHLHLWNYKLLEDIQY